MNNEEKIEIGKMLDTMGYRLDMYSREFGIEIESIVDMWDKEDPHILPALLREYRKMEEIKTKALTTLRRYEFMRIAKTGWWFSERGLFSNQRHTDIKTDDELLSLLKSYNRPRYKWIEHGLGGEYGLGGNSGSELDLTMRRCGRMEIRNYDIDDDAPPDYW